MLLLLFVLPRSRDEDGEGEGESDSFFDEFVKFFSLIGTVLVTFMSVVFVALRFAVPVKGSDEGEGATSSASDDEELL